MKLLETGLLSTLAGASLFLGVLLIQFRESWARRNTVFLVGFAAGTMMAITFVHILPEAVELSAKSPALASWALPVCLFSFLAFYVLEQFVIMHPCEEEGCESHSAAGELGLVAILFHAVLDGVLIGVGFEVSPALGIVTSMGILFHKLPVGVTAMSLFFVAGFSRGKALARATGLAVATPCGALLAYFVLRGVSEPAMGLILAASGGSFLYVAASDLIPMTHRHHRRGAFLTVFAGAGGMFLVGLLLNRA